MWKFLFLVLLPGSALAQVNEPVEPIISKDYLQQIKPVATDRSLAKKDSLSNINNSRRTVYLPYYGFYSIKNISTTPSGISVQASQKKYLYMSGYYSMAYTITKAVQLPELQNTYAQGRSQNGNLQWRGAETNEMFSYGPAIQALTFDGSSYPYDINGKLVLGGNGIKANVYNNNILGNDHFFSQEIKLATRLIVNGTEKNSFSLLAAKSYHAGIINENTNRNGKITASAGAKFKYTSITATYSLATGKCINDNNFGILNKAYQNSLLTPATFSNGQGQTIGAYQRSYSNEADNPAFLLNNDNYQLNRQHNAGITIENGAAKIKYKIVNTFEDITEKNRHSYGSGAAFFGSGITDLQENHTSNYYIKTNLSYEFNASRYYYRPVITLTHIFSDNNTILSHSADNSNYTYRRATHDASLNLLLPFDHNSAKGGLLAGNKAYISNTSIKNYYFLPDVSTWVIITDSRKLKAKLTAAYHQSKSELPVSESLAKNALQLYSASQAFQYFPVKEVTGYEGIVPTDKKEYNVKIEMNYNNNRLVFEAEAFLKNNSHEIFPVFNGNQLLLKNIASSQSKGIELGLNNRLDHTKFTIVNNLSFTLYRSKITSIEDGYNNTIIEGFSDVHKALAEDQPVGVIIGSAYKRDANKNVIIGTDGFPLVDNLPKIIGNPTPDFVVKAASNFSSKKWSVGIDLEWQRGGDVWNGTQAALDYYGRSNNTALLRNVTNYIFNGVLQDGHVNNIPVSFYNAAQPFTNNRWARYGVTGVAEAYIQKADHIKIGSLTVGYNLPLKKYFKKLSLVAYANDIMLWCANKGANSNQLLYGQVNSSGLNFFNLPASVTYGFNISLQF